MIKQGDKVSVTRKGHWGSDLFWLAILISLMFSFFLGSRPLNVPDESRYCEIAREMLVLHDFVTPHIDGIKYFEKPPLFYWMQAGALHLFGLSEWSCRLVNAIMGLLGCLVVYVAGRKLFDRKTGIYSAAILSSSILYFILSRMVTLDMTLTVMLISCLFCFLIGVYDRTSYQKYYFYLMYFFSGLAVLTKGLVGFIFPGCIVFLWLCFTRNWIILKKVHLIAGCMIFLAVVLPWHILVQLKNPEFFHFYFIDQHFYRYFTTYAHRAQPPWFFLAVIILGFFPWVGYLIGAAKNFFNINKDNDSDHKDKKLFIWISVLFILIFYCFSKSQLIPYILPLFPLMAILVGSYFGEIKRSDKSLLLWIQIFFMAMIAVGFIVAILLNVSSDIAIHYTNLRVVARIVMGIIVLNILLVPWLFYKKDFITAMVGQFILSILLLFGLCIAAPFVYMDSIKPLAEQIQKISKPSDRVIAYKFYYQDLPFYLERETTLVDWKGELEFGDLYPSGPHRLVDQGSFWSDAYQKKIDLPHTFFVMPKFVFDNLEKEFPQKEFVVLSQTKKDILVKIDSKGENH